ncbi:hypothetical protein Lser_V15G35225 [Lactuca serriola]
MGTLTLRFFLFAYLPISKTSEAILGMGISKYVIDALQAVCIKEAAGSNAMNSLEEETSRIGLTFGVIYGRRYLLRRSALKLFMVDRSNFFFDFGTMEGRKSAYRPIVQAHPSHLNNIYLATQNFPLSPSPVRDVLDNLVLISTIPSLPINKEEEVGGFPVRKSSPVLSESGLRNRGRGSLTSLTSQSSVIVPINPTNSNIISTNNALGVGQASEMAKRPMLGTDERMVQQHPPVSSLSSRMMLPQSGVKSTDGDNGNGGEGGGVGTRVFSPSGVPGIQWIPGSSFQTQHEGGQFRGRTEIAPDQREKFLQRFEQIHRVFNPQ